MKSQISLTNLIAAVLLFAVAVVMHEAVRADSLLGQGITPVADRLVVKPGKKPLGFKGSGGTSHIQDNCTHGEDDITRCDDCEVNWDVTPPTKVCKKAAICISGISGQHIPCPPA
ncbi:MAG: hypothetical protein ACREC3_11960 [Methyloceanibacter sp.]